MLWMAIRWLWGIYRDHFIGKPREVPCKWVIISHIFAGFSQEATNFFAICFLCIIPPQIGSRQQMSAGALGMRSLLWMEKQSLPGRTEMLSWNNEVYCCPCWPSQNIWSQWALPLETTWRTSERSLQKHEHFCPYFSLWDLEHWPAVLTLGLLKHSIKGRQQCELQRVLFDFDGRHVSFFHYRLF